MDVAAEGGADLQRQRHGEHFEHGVHGASLPQSLVQRLEVDAAGDEVGQQQEEVEAVEAWGTEGERRENMSSHEDNTDPTGPVSSTLLQHKCHMLYVPGAAQRHLSYLFFQYLTQTCLFNHTSIKQWRWITMHRQNSCRFEHKSMRRIKYLMQGLVDV